MPRRTAPSAASEFVYDFEELPLLTVDGFEAGLVNGSAQISYWRDDGQTEWFVGKIYLTGHRRATAAERADGAPLFITHNFELECDPETDPHFRTFESKLYLQIFGVLEDAGRWRDAIQAKVDDALAAERRAA